MNITEHIDSESSLLNTAVTPNACIDQYLLQIQSEINTKVFTNITLETINSYVDYTSQYGTPRQKEMFDCAKQHYVKFTEAATCLDDVIQIFVSAHKNRLTHTLPIEKINAKGALIAQLGNVHQKVYYSDFLTQSFKLNVSFADVVECHICFKRDWKLFQERVKQQVQPTINVY